MELKLTDNLLEIALVNLIDLLNTDYNEIFDSVDVYEGDAIIEAKKERVGREPIAQHVHNYYQQASSIVQGGKLDDINYLITLTTILKGSRRSIEMLAILSDTVLNIGGSYGADDSEPPPFDYSLTPIDVNNQTITVGRLTVNIRHMTGTQLGYMLTEFKESVIDLVYGADMRTFTINIQEAESIVNAVGESVISIPVVSIFSNHTFNIGTLTELLGTP
jgi:hypothetical protein